MTDQAAAGVTIPKRLCKRCSTAFPIEENICPACGTDQTLSRSKRTELDRAKRLQREARAQRQYLMLAFGGLIVGGGLPYLISYLLSLMPPAATTEGHHYIEKARNFVYENIWGMFFALLGLVFGLLLAGRSVQRNRRSKKRLKVSSRGGHNHAGDGDEEEDTEN